jgi:hypothetical protein
MRFKVLWLTAVIALGGTGVAMAADDVSVALTADVLSKYIWRGQDIVNDWVLQPSASVGYQGLTGTVWSSIDLTGDLVGAGQFNEVDLTLDYTHEFPGVEKLSYSVGIIDYQFPNTGWDSTNEVYGGLAADVPLSPAIRWYYDFDEIDGSYVQLSLGHTLEKLHQWRDDCYCDLQLGASVGYGSAGYNDGYFGVDEGAFNDLTLSAGLPVSFGKWTLKPVVAYSTMLNDDIRAATAHSDNLWAGLSAAVSF